jgi:peptidyl-prolyl cis-trans isomerase SurA
MSLGVVLACRVVLGGGLLALVLAGWPPALGRAQTPQVLDGIAAVVNDDIVTISEVRDTVALEAEQLRQQASGLALQEQLKDLHRRALTGLVNLRLQLERARKLSLQVTDEDVTYHIETLKRQNQISTEPARRRGERHCARDGLRADPSR